MTNPPRRIDMARSIPLTGEVTDTFDMLAPRASRTMRSARALGPTLAQLNDVMMTLQVVTDRHPDPLVIAREYPEPLPGWGVVRVYDEIDLLMVRVTMMGEEEKATDCPVWLPRESWHHPSVEFVREVARQFVMYERLGFHLDHHLSGYPVSLCAVRRAEVWIVDDHGGLSRDSVYLEPSLIDDDDKESA